ncbi:MAG TPA: UPF0182 family protein [Micromonosporaceae bacterium]
MKTPLPRVSRRGRVAAGVVVVLIVLYTLLSWAVRIWTDWLWYQEVQYTEVFSTTFRTRALLFGIFGGLMAAWLAGNLYLAYRLRPMLRPNSPEQLNLDRYRMRVTPRIGLYTWLAAGFIGLITGLSAQGRWQQWLLFWNSQDFGREDPEFGMDVGFYVFEYPFWRFLLGMAFTAVVIGVLGALFMHYLYGGVRLQGAGDRMTTAARAHLSALVGLFVLFKAVAYFLDRYGLLLGYNEGLGLAGAGYTDINALLPAKEILVWITIIAAVSVLVFANAVVRNLVWPGVALALVAVSAIAIGGVYPWSVQTFEVRPNIRDREAEYISRTIDATRYSYDIQDTIIRENYPVTNTVPPADLDKNLAARDSVRLLDPSVVPETYSRLQQVRGFYEFNDKLDVDRYRQPDGTVRDYVVGVRELEPDDLSGSQLNWQNRHTIYTHGYGFVAAPANDPCGTRPRFVSGFLSDESGSGSQETAECVERSPIFAVERPQIYYGELVSDYSIVGKASSAVQDREFDRPAASGGESEQVRNTYDGKGGVPVNTLSRRMLYGWHYGEWNFLLSDVLNENSKVLYVRDPRDRVQKVAPFLTLDGDPYPAVVGGRVVWIVDGYTTASSYPYSEPVNLEDAASDALTGTGTAAQVRRNVNYIRNSVKAVVDAYDGAVTLYEWDNKDPVLRAWDKVYGGLVRPKESIPAELKAHFRYPEDMFKVQRDLLARFHVSDPNEFFSADDFWQVPKDPTEQDGEGKQPPFYLLADLSKTHQGQPTFQLTSAMNANKRQNLSALISGYYDGDKPRLLVLELPVDTVDGPLLVQQQIRSFGAKDISDFQRSQTVVFGNLLTLPVGGGLLYAEPLYLKSKHQDAYPTLQRVLLVYGGCTAFEPTLREALTALSERRNCSGESPDGDGEAPPVVPTPSPDGSPGGTPPDTSDPDVARAVDNLQKAIADLRAAQRSGDFEAYGKALEALEKAAREFEKATGTRAPVTTPPPSPTGSPATASPGG